MASHPSCPQAHTLHRYCERFQLGDWKKQFRKVNLRMACDFILHLCETCNITSLGTSWQYFKQFRQRKSTSTLESSRTRSLPFVQFMFKCSGIDWSSTMKIRLNRYVVSLWSRDSVYSHPLCSSTTTTWSRDMASGIPKIGRAHV